MSISNFQFGELFIEELGWSHPRGKKSLPVTIENQEYNCQRIAEVSGVVVLEVSREDIPDSQTRQEIQRQVTERIAENLLIFVDSKRTRSLWYWVKREGSKSQIRDHLYIKGQPGDLFLGKLAELVLDITDFEDGEPSVVEIAKLLQKGFDIEKITKKFYQEFQREHLQFLPFIQGIDRESDRKWYTSVILNRLMFVYFLQRKGFIDNDFNYLQNQFQASQRRGENLFYRQFLQTLFFQAFAKPESQRDASVTALVGKVKYLNGGLFLQHPLENIYQNICIDDQAFENILDLFSRYSWNLDDTPGGRDDEINPDVLGYIFEKYINQKAFGAYYTRPEITEYLCDRTINKWIVERSNQLYPRKQFASISELLINLDSPLCEILIKDILPQLSILDPACGSGAFLVAAMKTLIAIYSGVIGTIELRGDSKLKQWLAAVRKSHPSLGYYIKKRIISDNLYGVDIMEEATEIAKLRLFLALVAAAQSVTELEPLPNIDFNIMSGNSLIGLIRVDEKSFNLMGEENILQSLTAQNYQAILAEKNRSIELYKEHAFQLGEVEGTPQENRLQMLRNHIEDVNRESLVKLNQILLDEFSGKLSIKYESAQLTGKAKKRLLTLSDMQSLKPFHWGYHFDKLITEKGGFDVIITNPPWEVFKPQAKEFFSQHSDLVTKNKMDIKTFEKEQKKLLTNPEIAQAWLDYQSQYPHVSLYFRSSEQYKNQISIVNGKKQGTDINLYKLFVEQCFNLLHPQGECGMVIPSGIYTDLGTKQLREMLFSQTKVTGLFCFENRKTIFEGVDSRFKFVILSFEKNKQTLSFPVEFMRHDVEELQRFPHKDSLVISVDLIRKLSPDSLSVMEFKQDIDIQIAEKMSRFPLLGETLPDTWNLKLTSEFHMTNDSYLFKTEPAKGRLPLYEGKMIHQFTHQYALPKYWLDEKEARQALLKRGEVDKGQILDYQTYRLGFRSVSSSTNERSLISSLIPKLVFCGNSLSISECEQNNFQDNQSFKIFIVAVLNSFLIDWMLRQKVSQNLNFFYIYQLPIPRLKEGDRYFEEIVEKAAKLICVSEEFDELAKEVGIGSHKNGVTEETERAKIRAKLDAIVAHLYELNEIEFQHILSTFPLVPESVKTATLKAYQNL
ncbi:MAG: Eco57I restriction-modification methylase domain-containing protein [Microcystis sp. M113S1]|uniref:Eco57I restriction-modification methylase domain-containing protein n=1 Tax=Microcystis sp. M113S1 TaxID=2771104 RepID=UPI00258CBFC2|nr:DNA methyltransferase [Microcystis sp. M113S1]MCA2939381.1 Eco57I restriction-modification methylase domain-containing protein [Microcystis sp. M113S1]